LAKKSVIEKTNRFKGELKVNGNLEIYGIAEGEIEVSNCLTVEGVAKGNIKTKCAIVKGTIEGKIECKDFFEAEKGKIHAKIKSPKIIVSEFVDYRKLEDIIEI